MQTGPLKLHLDRRMDYSLIMSRIMAYSRVAQDRDATSGIQLGPILEVSSLYIATLHGPGTNSDTILFVEVTGIERPMFGAHFASNYATRLP